MPRFAAAALLAAGLGAAPGVWSLRPGGAGDAREPAPPHEAEAPRSALIDPDAGLPLTRSLVLLAAVFAAGLHGGSLRHGGAKTELTARGVAGRVGRGCLGTGLVYAVLFAMPFVAQPSGQIAAARSFVPEGAAMVQAAIDRATHHHYGSVAVSLFGPDGQTLSRQRVEAGSFLLATVERNMWLRLRSTRAVLHDLMAKVPYAWSQLKFNWIKSSALMEEEDVQVAQQQCHPTDRMCALLAMSKMPFTHRVALPGGIVLRSEGRVVGVLAVSGGTDAQNADVAAHAARSAGYHEMGDNREVFET